MILRHIALDEQPQTGYRAEQALFLARARRQRLRYQRRAWLRLRAQVFGRRKTRAAGDLSPGAPQSASASLRARHP